MQLFQPNPLLYILLKFLAAYYYSDFNIITLIKNKPKANTELTTRVKVVTCPENPGTKKLTTDDPNNIFDKSEKNLEIDSI